MSKTAWIVTGIVLIVIAYFVGKNGLMFWQTNSI